VDAAPLNGTALSDFEATLRQVELVLGDFDAGAEGEAWGDAESGGSPPALLEVIEMLARAHAELGEAARDLRRSRSGLRDPIDPSALEAGAIRTETGVVLLRADAALARAEDRLRRLAASFDLRAIGLSDLAEALAPALPRSAARP